MKNLKEILIEEMKKSLLANGYREMDRGDWLGFAGAERFEDGSEPLIKYDSDDLEEGWVSIFDANGLTLMKGACDPEHVSLLFEEF